MDTFLASSSSSSSASFFCSRLIQFVSFFEFFSRARELLLVFIHEKKNTNFSKPHASSTVYLESDWLTSRGEVGVWWSWPLTGLFYQFNMRSAKLDFALI